ncbi:uncharacterized protein LOC117600463 [Osmia lignaria lignaria]|uniref:uncharacterized protein LOC117600463 n=1 Tax=Osmia lignaria lignaria TaxID=1437193 RepID=UPI00402BB519
MSAKIFGLFVLLFVAHIGDAIIPLKKQIDIGLLNSVYYDPKTGLALKGAIETNVKNPLGQITFQGISCECKKLVCRCCTGLNETLFKIDQQSCTTLTYIPEDFAIKTSLSLNQRELVSSTISGKNPPPLCVSLPKLPFVTICVRVFDIYTVRKNLHACVDVETRIANAPVLVLHFNCVQVGLDGLSWGYPGSTNNVNIVQNQFLNNQTEVYDDVNFEPEDQESHESSSSTQSSEEEDQIGQLKL